MARMFVVNGNLVKGNSDDVGLLILNGDLSQIEEPKWYTDFSEYTSDQFPSDWEVQWHGETNELKVADRDGVHGDKVLSYFYGDTERNAYSWKQIPEVLDVDIVSKVRVDTDGQTYVCKLYARGSGTNTTETAYFSELVNGTLKISKMVSAAYTAISSIDWAYEVDTWYYIRFRVNGTDLKVKKWGMGESEPGTWDIETTDSSITTAGWVGVGANESNAEDCYWDFFSVATDSLVADVPTELVSDVASYQENVEILSGYSPINTINCFQEVIEVLSSTTPLPSGIPIVFVIT